MSKTFLPSLLLSLALVGCSSVQTNDFGNAPVASRTGNTGQRASTSTIQILYAEPRRDYDTLGTFSVRKYKPGWSDPTVSDAIPELREAAGRMGADAVIIRNVQSNNSRMTTIEGEAIQWVR